MNKKLLYVLMSLLSATAIYGMCTDHTEVTLACGIFGQINKHKQGKFNFPAFTTLGIANDSRGGDSCGIFIDGQTEYGINKTALFTNFLNTSDLLKTTKKCHIALGHCRKASVGAVDLQRAQPVVIRNENDEVEYVVMHNGTIHNYEALALKYIPFVNIKGMSDSQVMARIFYHTGFDVLNEYNGGAVFVIVDYRQEEPIIYAFKGSSKLYSTSQILTEERPFYFTVNNHSLYFSSIHAWLQPFSVNTIYTIQANTVVKFQDNEPVIHQVIDRSTCIQSQWYQSYNNSSYDYYNYGTTYSNNNLNANGEQITVNNAGIYRTKSGKVLHGSYYVQPNGIIGYAQSAMYVSFWQGMLLKNRLCYNFLSKFCTKSKLDEYSILYCIPKTLNYLSFYPSCIYDEHENDYKFYDNDTQDVTLYDGTIQYIGEDCIYIVENGIMVDCQMTESVDVIKQMYTDNLNFKLDYNMLNQMIITECDTQKAITI